MTENQQISVINLLGGFTCLGAECEDTCCKGWGMQVNPATKALYVKEAPELLESLDSGEAEIIMRRDPVTDECVKLTSGLCSIHAKYGEKFLGDACNFYPRITRAVGDERVMTATLSCPEVVRLALSVEDPFGTHKTAVSRLPETIKDYLPTDLSTEATFKVHEKFLEFAGDENLAPEQIMLAIQSVARSLEALPATSWPEAVPFYLKTAESRLPQPEKADTDTYYLVQAVALLINAAKKSARARLNTTLQVIEKALNITIDWSTSNILGGNEPPTNLDEFTTHWFQNYALDFVPIFRRWIQAELSQSFFPFGGLGAKPSERALILCVRFATLRLAFMAETYLNKEFPNDYTLVRVIQSLSRFLDHLADPALSFRIYSEAGWNREARLCGLVGLI